MIHNDLKITKVTYTCWLIHNSVSGRESRKWVFSKSFLTFRPEKQHNTVNKVKDSGTRLP